MTNNTELKPTTPNESGESTQVNVEATSINGNAKKPRSKAKRIILWTSLSLLLLILLAVAAAITWLGPIVEWYVEKHDMELVGRRIEMDNLRIKLFSSEASVDNLILYEADDSTHFARIGHLEAELALSELFSNHVHITRAYAEEAYLRIDQDVEEFNLDDMIEFIDKEYLAEETPEEEEGEPWVITLDNITIRNSHFAYFDHEIDQRWELTELNLATPRFYLDGGFSHIESSAIINDRAQLEGIIELDYNSWDFTFDGSVKEFPLAETYKYWTPYLNVGSITGIANADFSLVGNVMDIFSMDISGTATADGFGITASNGGKVLTTNHLEVGIEELNIDAERYILSSLVANGYSAEMIFEADGSTNFDPLFYDEPVITIESTATEEGEELYDVKERVTVTTSEEEAPFANMVLRIAHVDLKGGDFLYSDNTMHRKFEYPMREVAITGTNIDLMGQNNITLSAKLPKQGSVQLRWDGSLSDFHNQSLMLMLTNVDMEGLSPYVEYYTGFPITSGNLTFRSQNVVSNGALSGINQLGTYLFKVGQRDKEMDVELKLPLRLAVWVLTDKDDHIDIDLPISGHLDEPKFSYRKIILKAVGNLMLKLVASPFELMDKSKQDTFRHIDLDLLDPGLGSEHYARLDNMANALKGDSTLRVRLTQRVNYKRATQRIANLNLKIAYYNYKHGDKEGYLDMLAFSQINDTKMSNREVIAYADSLLTARGIDPSHMNAENKAMQLYGDVVEEQMVQLMEHRNRVIMDYMGFQHQDMPKDAFTINNVVVEDMKNYNGKDRFTVTMIIDEEEVELPVADDTTFEEDYYDAYALEDEPALEEPIIEDEDNITATDTLESGDAYNNEIN